MIETNKQRQDQPPRWEEISAPGAAIQVFRLNLAPEEREELTISDEAAKNFLRAGILRTDQHS